MRCMIFFYLLLFTLPLAGQSKTTLSPVQKEVITIDDSFPEEFKTQKILIQDKDGKPQGEFDRTKWRIVPRDKKVVYRQTRTVDCDKEKVNQIPKSQEPMFKRHTVSLLLGQGDTGLETKAREDGDLEVLQKKGLIFGFEYSYHYDSDWSLQGLLTSNNSVMAGVGYSFNL